MDVGGFFFAVGDDTEQAAGGVQTEGGDNPRQVGGDQRGANAAGGKRVALVERADLERLWDM